MDYFNNIEQFIKYNPSADLKKITITREGQTGEIKKISAVDRSEQRERYSFYGSILPFDMIYIPKKI